MKRSGVSSARHSFLLRLRRLDRGRKQGDPMVRVLWADALDQYLSCGNSGRRLDATMAKWFIMRARHVGHTVEDGAHVYIDRDEYGAVAGAHVRTSTNHWVHIEEAS
jgi:hypothetical protein